MLSSSTRRTCTSRQGGSHPSIGVRQHCAAGAPVTSVTVSRPDRQHQMVSHLAERMAGPPSTRHDRPTCRSAPDPGHCQATKVPGMTLPPYPDAPREDVVETIHGREIPDPYRWLEDSGSQQTKGWLEAEAELYASYVAGLPGLPKLRDRLRELLGAGEVGPPVWRGGRQFFTRREPGQEHAVLYTVSPAGAERALIDPAVIDPAGLTTLDRWEPDHDGRLVAYQ